MESVKAIISYKTKVREFADNGGRYIAYKKAISRHDCNLKPHQHTYFNADMFPSMLKRAHLAAINSRDWCRIDQLPPGVTVDASGFLATVRVEIYV